MLCLRADRQKEAMDAYLMSGVRRILYALCGEKANMPSYRDYLHDLRSSDRPSRKQDDRTADQIVDDLIRKLREGEDQ